MREAGIKEGLPPAAVYCLTNSTIEGTEVLMKHNARAVILQPAEPVLFARRILQATAFGVDPQCSVFIERPANVEKRFRIF